MKTADSLARYRAKRDFSASSEPRGKPGTNPHPATNPGAARYTVQRHEARRLHYDFRLELDGVLKSWAVPKGPSLDAEVKRLAVQVEDHPLEYGDFEGRIPAGHYGAGTVAVWDKGSWIPLNDPHRGYQRGHLKFRLEGKRLHGEWLLVRTQRDPSQWLLRKLEDRYAKPGHDAEASESSSSASTPSASSSSDPAATRRSDVPGAKRAAAEKGIPDSKRSKTSRGALPQALQPQLATLVDHSPTDPGWAYELKFDGYRVLCRCEGDEVRFFTRSGQDLSSRLEHLAEALHRRPKSENALWLDGEIVVIDNNGLSRFSDLQAALSDAPERIVYMVFDLLFRNGNDLRSQPQSRRYAELEALFARLGKNLGDPASARVRRSERAERSGAELWAEACRRGLEGLIGKRLDATYGAGRSTAWIKLKCRPRQEVVVGGYTLSAKSRGGLGALLVGVRDDGGRLQYAGRIGTGFAAAKLRGLRARLDRLASKRCPFETPPEDRRADIRWVRPDLVVEASFASWTADRRLRQAAYEGLREDKPAHEVRREVAAAPVHGSVARESQRGASSAHKRALRNSKLAERKVDKTPARVTASAGAHARVAGVTISHPDRVVFAAPRITKLELAAYYERVGAAIMPHLEGRPLSLLRCPDGVAAGCFFQKHLSHTLPPGIEKKILPGQSAADASIVVESLPGLIGLVQHGVVELHTWGAQVPDTEHADRITLDLDPDPTLGWRTVAEAARLARTLLEEIGLAAFLKTTGGKGLHVVAPIRPTRSWDEVKPFAKALADHLVSVLPERFTATLSKAQRKGKIFVDYLRNAREATAIAAYSVRAREGAPVAVPLDWDELKDHTDLRGDCFNVLNVPQRIELGIDPWREFTRSRRNITRSMLKTMGLEDTGPRQQVRHR